MPQKTWTDLLGPPVPGTRYEVLLADGRFDLAATTDGTHYHRLWTFDTMPHAFDVLAIWLLEAKETAWRSS